ncbi:MAG: tyrosine-protein phosphatase [Armatimonadota bacterium]
MIDIHTHILPGVDDGALRVADALLMAEDAAAQGVHTVVATPHLYWAGRQALSAGDIRKAVQALNEGVQAEGIPISILPGCEIPLSPDLLENLERGEWMSLGDNARTVLVEPPWQGWPAYATGVLQHAIETGWTVVLAHPERNGVLQREKSLVAELVQMGVHLQVTTGSLVGGKTGPAAARCAYELMERRLVSVVASDCHDTDYRRCDLRQAYALLRRVYGQHVARMLTTTVPNALLRGEKVDVEQVWQKVSTDENRWKRFLRGILRRETDDG